MKNNFENYYVAGRKNGIITISLSLVSTIIGASAGIGLAGHYYKLGFPGIWWLLSGALGLMILALFFISRVNISKNYTLPELFGNYYGKEVRIFSGLCISISWLGIISAQILAAGFLLHFFFPNINLVMSFITVGIIFIVYTAYGGQKAIIKTDVLQFVLLFLSIIILFFVAFEKNVFFNNLFLIPQSFITQKFGLIKVVEMLLIVGFPFFIGPDIYSRLFSANSINTAKKSLIISAVIITLIALLLFFIVSFYIAIHSHQIENPDMILYDIIDYYISDIFIKGIIILGLLSLIMSSADTCLLSAGSIFTYDVLGCLFPNNHYLKNNIVKVTRFSIIIIGLISIFISIFSRGIIANLFVSYKVYTAALGFPGLFMLLFKKFKIPKKIIVISICASCLTLIITYFIFGTASGLIALSVSALICSSHLLTKKIFKIVNRV
jgi:solute:Na+ symporter, SSS family